MAQNEVPQVSASQSQDKALLGRSAFLGIAIALAVMVLPVLACAAFGFAISASNGSAGGGLGPAIGVIRVEGVIVSGESSGLSGSVAGSDTIVQLIEEANDNTSISAIVLRVNSPGGGVVASDEIHHALLQVDKPIVVSMGDTAASGGYYVATAADYIYATPYTITGSIGVISEVIVVDGLLEELGVSVEVIRSGDLKDLGSPYRPMTEEERALLQMLIDEMYEGFVSVVAEGRGLPEEDVRALADGRVFTGRQALGLGLVDGIGYFPDAIAKAAELAGITGQPRIIELEPEVDFWASLYGFQSQSGWPFTLDILRELSAPAFEFRYIGG